MTWLVAESDTLQNQGYIYQFTELMGFHMLNDSLNGPEQEIFKTVQFLQAISAVEENSPMYV